MFNLSEYKSFLGVNPNKKQIVISHTSREANEYLASLSHRYNDKYEKYPHFLVDKKGDVTQLIGLLNTSKFLKDEDANKKAIIITLENLGWLEYDLNREAFFNWKGDKVEDKPYVKKWRDYDYWDNYTEQQTESLIKLVNDICEKMGIPKIFIGHNVKDNNVHKFSGIISRSNFDTIYTDVSPAFDISYFRKNFEHE